MKVRAHVEKRSKDRYTIVIDKGRNADGGRDRDYIPTEITNKRKAEEEADRILQEYRNGTYIPPSTLTFGDFLDVWLKDYGLQKLSDRTYEFDEKMFELHVKPRLGSISLDQLMPLHLQRYYNYLRTEGRKDGKPGGLSESTVFKHHCILHKVLKTGVKWKMIRENPADFVEIPKRPDSDVASYYEPDQAVVMLECARNEPIDKYSMVSIAVYGGTRRGETIGLRRQDIDWDNNILRIRQTVQYTKKKGIFIKGTKSKKGIRDIKVPDLVMDALRTHLANQEKLRDELGEDYIDNDLVFCQDDGKPMFPDTITSWFRKFLINHNLPKIRFHDLRHTNITIMIANKIPDNEIARRAGHADPATSKRLYGHVYASMKDEAASAIENALKPAAKKEPDPPQPTSASAKIIAFPKRNLA
ncbi:site-specific integrase [Desulfosporosinus sp.]|uniref:tyrosine-type recombinase/integrase n=1 Tax=Desulfosporosinus sp. TaxID=157907 RepID=UPI0025C140BE|nr:site-specific integrase [Desulfosporosinus sp.]MBC2721225.1 site-specific integrase [Desulfosporosinus sp.]MBC2728657.1 site-specific integrase [Desulfosporosinus sp.]